MNTYVFFSCLIVLGLICLWIGKSASKGLKNNDDYFLMGRKLTFLPLCLTLLATQLGGGTLFGASQEAYQKGWIVLFYPLGVSLGLIVLGLGFGKKLREFNVSTVAEIFEKVYGSRNLRTIASVLSVITFFFILITQAIAARSFFITLGYDQPLIFSAFWLVLVIYTVMGGLKAVVNTDSVQALFILAILLCAFFSVDFSAIDFKGILATPSSGSISWMSWLFLPLLFMLIEQDMGQRCFAAKKPKTIAYAAIASGVLLMITSSIAMFFGVVAKNLGLEFPPGSCILMEVMAILTNPIISSLFSCAVLMAIISTADSVLCSISSNLACDFFLDKKTSDKKRITYARLLTLLTGMTALACSFLFTNVVPILIFSYEFSVSILFIPTIATMLSKSPSRLGAITSIAAGTSAYLFFKVFPTTLPKEVIILSFSTLAYFTGQTFEKRQRIQTA